MMVSDITQVMVVTKNEIIKCVRGKKFMVSLIIVFLVFILITALQFLTNSWDSINSMGMVMSTYFSTFPMVITLVVALLSSIAIVSEFEERTALILFTRPIRRTTIFIGKVLSCAIIEAMMILAYYIMATAVAAAKASDFSAGDMAASFGIAILYTVAASGIAFVVSSFFKKGSVCTIITILLILIITPIVSAVAGNDGGENWYMLDQAGNTLYTCVPGYVDMYNEFSNQFVAVVDNAIQILEGFTDKGLDPGKDWLQAYMATAEFQELDPTVQVSVAKMFAFLNLGTDGNLKAMIMVLKMMTTSSMITPMEYPDVGKEALVLVVWAFVGYIIAWVKFVRREF
jgi:ABC-2 type transport system permease protein